MLTKQKIISIVENLPEPIVLDDVLEQIVLIEKIETGLAQSQRGEIIPDEELDARLAQWLS